MNRYDKWVLKEKVKMGAGVVIALGGFAVGTAEIFALDDAPITGAAVIIGGSLLARSGDDGLILATKIRDIHEKHGTLDA